MYKCMASNDHGDVIYSTSLVVTESKFVIQIQQELQEEQDFTLFTSLFFLSCFLFRSCTGL